MKKKMLAQAITLGLLLAAPCGAWAADTIAVTDGSVKEVGAGEYNQFAATNGSTVNVNAVGKDVIINHDIGKVIGANYGLGIALKGDSADKVSKVNIKADKLTFTSQFDGGNAGWQSGNSELTIDVKELYLHPEHKDISTITDTTGSKSDYGFQFKGNNNKLNVYADKVEAYVIDSFVNAQGGDGESVVNIGSSDRRIGSFVVHTTADKNSDWGVVAILQANEGNTVNLYAEEAFLDGSHYKAGGVIGTGGWGTVNVDVKDLTIDGNICGSYGGMNNPDKEAILNVTADTLNMTGDVNIGSLGDKNITSNFSRDTKVNIKVNGDAKLTGDINVYGNTNVDDKVNVSDNESVLNVEFNGNSTITGDINVLGSEKDNATQKVAVNLGGTGTTNVEGTYNLAKDGDVNFTGGTWEVNKWQNDGTGDSSIGAKANVNIHSNMDVDQLELAGSANLKGDNVKVTTKTLTGDNGIVYTESLNNKLTATDSNVTNLTVKGSGEIADLIAADSKNAQNLANVVSSNGVSIADKAATEAGVIAGETSFDIENGKVTNFKQSVNENNQAVSNMASIALMVWRAENNDMNKRLGELRNSTGEHGVWARMMRGESKYGEQNVKNQYNTYQLGYDEKLSTNDHWTVGAAISYTDGQSSFANGSGENKHTGLSLYGSYLGDDGSFVDLIAKYARLKHDFDVNGGIGSGDYDTNGYSVSAEYGKRFTKDNGFWLEPQVELTYGKVGSVSYMTDNGASVRQDGMDSIVGRLGVAAGKNIKNGNVYLRASYLYDFDGETSVTMSKGASTTFEQDLGGGWWEVGVGTNLMLSKATHLYFDVEKTYGGNVATPWQWNTGMRWSF